MNWKTFYALLARDGHVARRNLGPMLLQNLLQPLLFTFVFGRVMTSSGMMPAAYKNMLLPGVMAISMVMAGVQAVAMPLIAEFQFTREIEDRLLAPIETGWLAVAKIATGMIQAILAGLGVSILSRYTLGLDSDQKQLVTLDVAGFPLERHWYFVYPVGKNLPAAAQAFMEFTRRRAKELAHEGRLEAVN